MLISELRDERGKFIYVKHFVFFIFWILENKKVFLLNMELGVCNYTLATQFVGYFGWKYRPENVCCACTESRA